MHDAYSSIEACLFNNMMVARLAGFDSRAAITKTAK